MAASARLHSLHVEDFRGERDVEVQFFPDVSFIIGRNGTGKTTLINLISAALTVNTESLASIEFKTLSLQLALNWGAASEQLLVLSIEKKPREDSEDLIEYRFDNWPSASGDPHFEFPLITRRSGGNFIYSKSGRRLASRTPPITDDIRQIIERDLYFRAITVHRASSLDIDEDNEFMSTVDRKIHRQSREISQIASEMDKAFNKLLQDYQAEFFVNFIDRSWAKEIENARKNIDLARDGERLNEIFQSLSLGVYQYQIKLSRHNKEAAEAFKAMDDSGPVSIPVLAAYLDAIRLHSFVEKWEVLQARRREIFESRDTLCSVINDLYVDKKFTIGEGNAPQFRKGGRDIDVYSLASGEKQMFIFLSEAFIEQKKSGVLIADEPEISLHIEWQAKFVEKMRLLNPNVQLILATHSPDIVSSLKDNVISLG